MFKLNKKLNKVYRKYQEDIWGKLRLLKKNTKVTRLLGSLAESEHRRFQRFFFVINLAPSIRRRKRLSAYGELLETRKKICIFYGGLRKITYRSIGKEAALLKGDLGCNIVSLLERSLAFAVYRFNFASTIGLARKLVRNGHVLVNKEIIKQVLFRVPVGAVIEIYSGKRFELYTIFLKRLVLGQILMLMPSYTIISYNIMQGIFYREISSVEEVLYPFKTSKTFFISDYINRI